MGGSQALDDPLAQVADDVAVPVEGADRLAVDAATRPGHLGLHGDLAVPAR